MIQQSFTEAERKRMLRLAFDELARVNKDDELVNIIAMLGGVDTTVTAQRAYPARRIT